MQTLREGVRMMERDEASVDKFYATSTTYSSFVSSSLIASLGSGSLVGRPATVGRAVVRNAAPVGARALPPAVGQPVRPSLTANSSPQTTPSWASC